MGACDHGFVLHCFQAMFFWLYNGTSQKQTKIVHGIEQLCVFAEYVSTTRSTFDHHAVRALDISSLLAFLTLQFHVVLQTTVVHALHPI